jgi:hypothetical protein
MIVHYKGPAEGTIAERVAAVAAWRAQLCAGRPAPAPAPAEAPPRFAAVSPREWWGFASGYEHTAGERRRGMR